MKMLNCESECVHVLVQMKVFVCESECVQVLVHAYLYGLSDYGVVLSLPLAS